MGNISQTPLFRKTVKKLPVVLKKALDVQVDFLFHDPKLGELKKGDLAGIRVHKFKFKTTLYLLGYVSGGADITLLAFGVHENFYKDLKRYLG